MTVVMKAQYQCDICHCEFSTEEEALECEERHKHALRYIPITSSWDYEPYAPFFDGIVVGTRFFKYKED